MRLLKIANLFEVIKKNTTPAIRKDTQVFENPSKSDLMETEGADKFSDKAFAGFILPSGSIFVWDRYDALHQGVREALYLPDTIIPFQFYMGDSGVIITDNIRNSVWDDRRSEVPEIVLDNKYLEALGLTDEINFYDEAIVGDWRDLEDETS